MRLKLRDHNTRQDLIAVGYCINTPLEQVASSSTASMDASPYHYTSTAKSIRLLDAATGMALAPTSPHAHSSICYVTCGHSRPGRTSTDPIWAYLTIVDWWQCNILAIALVDIWACSIPMARFLSGVVTRAIFFPVFPSNFPKLIVSFICLLSMLPSNAWLNQKRTWFFSTA